jgi:hypothetical protein
MGAVSRIALWVSDWAASPTALVARIAPSADLVPAPDDKDPTARAPPKPGADRGGADGLPGFVPGEADWLEEFDGLDWP